MKDLEETSYFLGIKIHRNRSQRFFGLSQRAYIDYVLKCFNIQNCSPSIALVVMGNKFSLKHYPKNQMELDQMEHIPYASAI